jgi:hypothetical protein
MRNSLLMLTSGVARFDDEVGAQLTACSVAA